MLLLDHTEEAVIDATPEQLFALVTDVSRHPELAGSREVLTIRLLDDGPLQVGSTFEADEDIAVGRGRNRFISISTVLELDPPHVFSWSSMPPGRPQPQLIQWWFRLAPVAGGTRVTHQVRVEFGPLGYLMLKPVYGRMRAGAVREGMRKTLVNLDRACHPTAA